MKKILTIVLTLVSMQVFAQTYQPPQAIAPANNAVIGLSDLMKSLTIRWAPVVPKPQGPVTYRLKIWQLMQGQNNIQAMKANTPIITKDFSNITQTTLLNLITGPCKPPYLCDFVWTVQALGQDGKPIGGNNGISQPSQFSAGSCDVNLTLKLQSVVCLPVTRGYNNFKICVSASYSSSVYNLTYSNTGSGFKAYAPSYTPVYTVSNITPALQVQNSGGATTINYCFDVSVPTGQTSIKVGLQGDDKTQGPIVCQPGAELDIALPVCKTCTCGTWDPLTVNNTMKLECGSLRPIQWKCNTAFNFISAYHCSPDNESCQPKTSWEITYNGTVVKSGSGAGSIAGNFTPADNGTYTLNLSAVCGNEKCPVCSYTFVVNNCCVQPPSGMVGWWPGDNNANDISGLHNNGALQGGAGYAAGEVAGAFSLTNATDFIAVPDNSSLNFGTGDFSMDAWIKTSDASDILNIVDKRTGTSSNPVGYSFFIVAGKLACQVDDGQGTLNHVSNTTPVSDGKWHLVAVTIDRKSKTGGKLYVDGAVIFTFDPTTRPRSISNNVKLLIGQRYLDPATNFQGQIDELEIFNRVLQSTEISSIFTADSAGKCKIAVTVGYR